MRICAIIPVYNNANTIIDVLKRTRAELEPDIIVVCDGSTDGSDDAARSECAKIVMVDENRGKGAAILLGLETALEYGYTHGIVLDADGQHLPEEIPKLYDAIYSDPDSLWVGVRRLEPGKVPKASLRGRSITNFWTTVAGWQVSKDAQCGFRAYPIEKTLSLGCKEPGFQFEMEVLVKAAWAGIKIGHLEINVHYPRENRVSHFDMKKDNLKFTWLSIKLFFGMLARLPMLARRKISARRNVASKKNQC